MSDALTDGAKDSQLTLLQAFGDSSLVLLQAYVDDQKQIAELKARIEYLEAG